MNELDGIPLVKGGPDVPTHLRQELEAGRVVFFCGAGISYPHLPDFKGLTEWLFEQARCQATLTTDPYISRLFKSGQYDRVLDWLRQDWNQTGEHGDLFGTKIVQKLTIPENTELNTHLALLRLSLSRDGKYRLVTTNQDNGFQECMRRNGLSVFVDCAPRLPIPKPHRWNSLVHLHGQIDQPSHTFVFTSSDFGAAYLTEGWATRFVLELMRHYTLVFVGYSVEDATIRYITDAIGLDDHHKESKFKKPYAFAAYTAADPLKNKDSIVKEWLSKKIHLIPYDDQTVDGIDHFGLHQTLRKWADIHQNGLDTWNSLLQTVRQGPPNLSDHNVKWILHELLDIRNRKFVSLFLLALSGLDDEEQLFAWLDLVAEREDEIAIKFTKDQKSDEKFWKRDSSEYLRIFTNPVKIGNQQFQLNSGTDWLLADLINSKLNNVALFRWACKRGGKLHPTLLAQLVRRLGSDKADLKLTEQAHKAWSFLVTCQPLLRAAETDDPDIRVTLNDMFRVSPPMAVSYFKPYALVEVNKFYGEEPPFVSTQENWVKAYLHLSFKIDNPMGMDYEPDGDIIPSDLNDPMTLTDIAHYLQVEFNSIMHIQSARMGDYSNHYVNGEIFSIDHHNQNSYSSAWFILVRGLADCFDRLSTVDIESAKNIARIWSESDYYVFQRLHLYALGCPDAYSGQEIENFLTMHLGTILWESEVKTEVFRLFRLRWNHLSDNFQRSIEEVYIAGPPREPEMENDERWTVWRDYSICGHLSWIRNKLSYTLLPSATLFVNSWIESNPEYANDYHEGFEYNGLISTSFDTTQQTEFKDYAKIFDPLTPFAEAMNLLKPGNDRFGFSMDWRQAFQDKTHIPDLVRLAKLAIKEGWNESWFWGTFLNALWQECDKGSAEFCDDVLLMMDDASDEVIREHASSWSQFWKIRSLKLTPFSDVDYPRWVKHFTRLMGLNEHVDHDINDSTSLQHFGGIFFGSILESFFATERSRGAGIPQFVKDSFDLLQQYRDQQPFAYRCGMDIWGRFAYSISVVDESWSFENLLPHFRWDKNRETAIVLWNSYLHRINYYPDFFLQLKSGILDAVQYYTASKHEHIFQQLVRYLTFVSIRDPELLTPADFNQITALLNTQQKSWCVSFVEHEFHRIHREIDNDAIEFNQKVWASQIKPWLDNGYWQQSSSYRSVAANRSWINMMLWIHNAEAFNELFPYLHPQVENDFLRWAFPLKDYPAVFYVGISRNVFDLLFRLIPEVSSYQHWATYIIQILDLLVEADPSLAQDPQYISFRQRFAP